MKTNIAILAAATMIASAWTASAAITTVPNPGLSSDIGARIRWGDTGFEASVFDSNPLNQNPTLNPGGTPVWGINNAYNFLASFDPTTGTLGLSVDFDLNNSFEAGESISRNSFTAPNGLVSYAGYGFRYLQISGNEGGSTARSAVNNLVINGQAMSSLTPGGTLLDTYYKDSSGAFLGPITITGDITFLTAGTGDERPSWNFRFYDPTPVPEPTTMIAGALLLLPFGASTLRMIRKARAA